MENWPALIATLQWRGLSIKLNQFYDLLKDKSHQNNTYKICDLLNIPDHKKKKLDNWQEIGLRELSWLRENKIDFTTPLDFDYPQSFLQLTNPPLLLTYKGRPVWLNKPCMSVVGSRNPTSDAVEWLRVHFFEVLKKMDIVVASGGARGIDQVAHSLSLRCQRPTVVFIPSGLNHIYPQGLQSWVSEIVKQGGAVVSQFSPFQLMNKSLFHQRNRLIAAISGLTFIVEARRRSGSLITAKAAMDLGKEICCLPSSPLSTNTLGGLDLLFDGAFMLREGDDLKGLIEKYSSSWLDEETIFPQHLK